MVTSKSNFGLILPIMFFFFTCYGQTDVYGIQAKNDSTDILETSEDEVNDDNNSFYENCTNKRVQFEEGEFNQFPQMTNQMKSTGNIY